MLRSNFKSKSKRDKNKFLNRPSWRRSRIRLNNDVSKLKKDKRHSWSSKLQNLKSRGRENVNVERNSKRRGKKQKMMRRRKIQW